MGERRERQRQSKGDRRADARWTEILDGAARVFRSIGYPHATLRHVAEEVGIDRASLYYYVSNKQDLLVELLARPMMDFERRCLAIAERDLPPIEKLRQAMVTHMEVLEGLYPESFIFIAERLDTLEPEVRAIASSGRRYHQLLTNMIRDGQASGDIRSDIDPVLAMHGMLGMLNWVHRWYHSDGPSTLPEIGAAFASMIVDGLRMPGDSGGEGARRDRRGAPDAAHQHQC